MAHLNTAVYLRALKQGLQLLPYIKSHRIFRQCQLNHQFNFARAPYSDSSDPESLSRRGLPRKLHNRVLSPEDKALDQELSEKLPKESLEQDSFGNRSRRRDKAISNGNNLDLEEDSLGNQKAQFKEKSNYPMERNFRGRFDQNNAIDQFEGSYEHTEVRYDRNFRNKGRLDRNYIEDRQDRFDRKYEGKERRFDRNEDRFDRSYDRNEGRFDRKYGGRDDRFNRNYEQRADRFDRNEGRFDRSYEQREGRFDRSYEHREGRFDRKNGHREDRFNRNNNPRADRFDRNEGRFDRSYNNRTDRFDRNEDVFDRSYEHREDRFDRKYGGREDRFDRNHEGRKRQNFNQNWMEDNDFNQKDHYVRKQGHNTKGNSRVNKIFSHTNVQMKFTDKEISGSSFYKKVKFPERYHRPAHKRYDNENYRDMQPSYKSYKHQNEWESLAVSEVDEDYESDEELQVQDFDDPDEIALNQRTRNYKRDGAYKRVRYDQPRSSAENEEYGLSSDLEADIDSSDRNEMFAERKSIRRSQSDPQLNSFSDDLGNHWKEDVDDKRKWKKSFGSLSDKRHDRRSDEDQYEEFVKPHRRLSATERKNVPVWYALQMKKLAKKGQIKEAVDVFEKWMLERDRVLPDYYTFSVLINILAKAGLTEKAFQIYNKMKKMGYYANAYVYSALFNACANSPWQEEGLQRAVKLRVTMKEKDWIPNYKTSTAMIKAFGKCGDLQTCFEIMDDICVRYPDELESSCFSTLLSVCIIDQQKGFKLALEVWQKMQDMGVKPSGIVYNFMLKAVRDSHFEFQLSNSEKSDTFIEESENPSEVLESSGEKSLVPSENLPNLLIEKHIDVDELLSTIDFTKRANKLVLFGGADAVLHHMKSNQVQPDIRIFSLLLDCSEHTLEAEDNLLEIMKDQKVRPDQEFCNSLIRRRALRCDNDNARTVLQLMTDNHLQPNMETLTNLALTCYQLKDGLQLLKDIEDLDSEPTMEVFSNLLRSSGMNFYYKTQLLIKMEELDLKPDTALIVNIEKYIEKGKQLLVKLENESLSGEKDSNLQSLQTGFEHFMKYYKGWLHRTNIDQPEHPYQILRKNQSEK